MPCCDQEYEATDLQNHQSIPRASCNYAEYIEYCVLMGSLSIPVNLHLPFIESLSLKVYMFAMF